MAEFPKNGELIYDYKVGDSRVNIFQVPEHVRMFYHIMPPEFKLTEEQMVILDDARKVMAQHKPKADELLEPDRVRSIFYDISSDIIAEHATRMGITLKSKENQMLSDVLVRETAGFGILELVLEDDKVQDITVNSPPGRTPMFVYHADAEDCETNVIPTSEEVQSWAARLRLMSGRPLDQANPVLDTSLTLPTSRARVAAITRNLSPYGLAFSFRRHRDNPWTYPLFIKTGMISPIGAGVMSFLVDGARTLLIAGTRGAGKTSFLGSTMVEIMRRYRIITVEDTLELPTRELSRLGYNILPMKVQSAIVQTESELGAAAGIRTSLRLGDSCLIVGEVRSEEARSLYEAMRIGALANVVAGTIHGESPYGIFDRVVNDLNVPATSFKATDIICVANPIKSADGLHKKRRIVQITEVRKDWKDDPLREHGFMDLLAYNPKTDLLEPTRELMEGESEVISSIAGRVKEWVGNFDAVWDNIKLRAKIKQTLVELSDKARRPDLLEADFVVRSNDMFHIYSGQVQKEHGELLSDEIYRRWEAWIKKEIKNLT
jgi:flagellar protein FlaI